MKPYFEEDGIQLFLGDCREVLPQMEDASVDFIFTDPPYGHNNNNNGDLIHRREPALGRLPGGENPPLARPICNDGEEANELIRWSFYEWKRLLRAEGCCCCCCCCGGGPDPQFARWSLWMDEALSFKQMVVWDKGPIGMGWHYRRSYETVLVGHKGARCRWYDTSDHIENIIRHIPKIIPQAKDHPTPKPPALVEWFMLLHTQRGDVILDPFAGHGTTLRVAKDLGRRAVGVEIDEEFCEVTAKRLSQKVLQFP